MELNIISYYDLVQRVGWRVGCPFQTRNMVISSSGRSNTSLSAPRRFCFLRRKIASKITIHSLCLILSEYGLYVALLSFLYENVLIVNRCFDAVGKVLSQLDCEFAVGVAVTCSNLISRESRK